VFYYGIYLGEIIGFETTHHNVRPSPMCPTGTYSTEAVVLRPTPVHWFPGDSPNFVRAMRHGPETGIVEKIGFGPRRKPYDHMCDWVCPD
jgi:hypothetical protein